MLSERAELTNFIILRLLFSPVSPRCIDHCAQLRLLIAQFFSICQPCLLGDFANYLRARSCSGFRFYQTRSQFNRINKPKKWKMEIPQQSRLHFVPYTQLSCRRFSWVGRLIQRIRGDRRMCHSFQIRSKSFCLAFRNFHTKNLELYLTGYLSVKPNASSILML